MIETDEGRVVVEESVSFGDDLPQYGQPAGFIEGGEKEKVHSDPMMWLEALDLLLARMVSQGVDFSEVRYLSGSGQQHGSVYLNANFLMVVENLSAEASLVDQVKSCLTRATSPIWMDSSTTSQCQEIAEGVGGNEEVCRRTGSEMVERFTGAQIRKFYQTDAVAYEKTAVVHLVSSFMASILAGANAGIDQGDGAGMNLINLVESDWDEKMVEATAPELRERLPELVDAGSIAGKISSYFVEKYGFASECEVVVFSGDNPCSLVGMGASRPGNVVMSLGTSDTIFAAMPKPVIDPRGYGHVFGNPVGGTGGAMSLICFKNGSLAREALKEELGVGWEAFEKEALSRVPRGEVLMLPFYEPEITPRVESDGPVWDFRDEVEDGVKIRALLEAQFLNMRKYSDWLGVKPEVILLTGGASQNDGIAQVVADVFNTAVERLEVTGSAGLGAAMRAAVAGGVPLESLEVAYSSPVERSRIEPEAGDFYAEQLKIYTEFLKKNYPEAKK
nr:xylulose kinase-like [Nerophis lumbriciformis]